MDVDGWIEKWKDEEMERLIEKYRDD